MKITDVSFARVAMPLEKPLGVGGWWNRVREFVLVWVETDDGLTGIGVTQGGYFSGQGRLVDVALEEYLKPLLLGEDPHDVEYLWNKMYRGCLTQGRKGVIVWAISALDIALWDIKSKAAGVPLWRYLGGARKSLPAYATGFYYKPGEGLEELRAEAERYKAMGLNSVKMKLGQLSIEEDAERIELCREVLGPAGRIAVDANNAWPNAHTAVRALREFEQYNLWFVEEPLPADNLKGVAELRRSIDAPIVNGEIAVTKMELRDLITQEATDILQFDTMMVGGISVSMKGVHLADCHDMQFIPAWVAELHLNVALAADNSFAVEWHVPDEGTLQFASLLQNPVEYRDGQLYGHERPGAGLELNIEVVREHLVAGSIPESSGG